jgi:hypothetical protein
MMMRMRSIALLSLIALAACSNDHALAGNWQQVTGTDAEGASLVWNGDGSKIVVHGAPRPDGGHGHPEATFTYDAASKALTIRSLLLGAGQPDNWVGTVAGDSIELTGGATKLTFRKGGKPAGH